MHVLSGVISGLDQSPLQIVSFEEFARDWSRNSGNHFAAFLIGFESAISDCYHQHVIGLLLGFNTLVFNGDGHDASGYTSVVLSFLEGHKDRKAVAFKRRDQVHVFKAQWGDIASRFPWQVIVVALDLDKDVARLGLGGESLNIERLQLPERQRYWQSRVALRMTRCVHAIGLGGDSVAACIAQASLADGAQWTVFALSRGAKEEHESLADVAMRRAHEMELVRGKDPAEEDGFAAEVESELSREARVEWLARVVDGAWDVPHPLLSAPAEVRGDREIILAASRRRSAAFSLANERLRADRELLLAALWPLAILQPTAASSGADSAGVLPVSPAQQVRGFVGQKL